MELGNALWGNSRGEYPVDRKWGDLFYTFLDKAGFDTYGHHSESNKDEESTEYGLFKNDTFEMFSYYWGDCTCGFEMKEAEWETTHKHGDNCYQNLVKNELLQKGWYYNEFGFPNPPMGWDYDRIRRVEESVWEKYCKQLGLTYPLGCAVHCTCDYDDEYAKWAEENDHAIDCPIVRPNFLYKPTGFQIKWYKYPFRDSYMNQNIPYGIFREILRDCYRSMNRKG